MNCQHFLFVKHSCSAFNERGNCIFNCGNILFMHNVWLWKSCNISGCGILELYTFLCNIINKSSVASIVVGQPKVTIIIVYYAILLVVLFGLKNIRTKYTRAEKERNIIKKKQDLYWKGKLKKRKE